jgi:branched-chain amino acid aminotransferase
LCRADAIPIRLDNFTLADASKASEAFVTGTFGGLTPVSEIDGRKLPAVLPGPVTKRLRDLYTQLKDRDAAR